MLIPAINEYQKENDKNIPLVLTNVNERRSHVLHSATKLLKLINNNKCIIPILDEYGIFVQILGDKSGNYFFYESVFKNKSDTVIPADDLPYEVKETICANQWLKIHSEKEVKVTFSMAKIINYMLIFIIKEKLSAIQKGHFELLSGKHSTEYISSNSLFSSPMYSLWMSRLIYSRSGRKPVDVIITYSDQAYSFIYHLEELYRRNNIKIMSFRIKDYYEPYLEKPNLLHKDINGKKVLIITDVTSTGYLIDKIGDLIKKKGGKIENIASIVEVNNYEGSYKEKFFSLCKYHIELYDPKDKEIPCPGCKQSTPKDLAIIDPCTNSPNHSLYSRDEVGPISAGNEENALLWEMVEEANALRLHALIGENEKHCYFYIDTYEILKRYIKDINWDIKRFYLESSSPEIILYPDNPSASKIATHIGETHFPIAKQLSAYEAHGAYTNGDESLLTNKRILIVDDGANTGETLNSLLNLCNRNSDNLEKVKICIFIDRLFGDHRKNIISKINESDILSIYRVPIPTYLWERNKCPLCLEIKQLKKYFNRMSTEAKWYINKRLEKLELVKIEEGQTYDTQEATPKSIYARIKASDFIYSKERSIFLNTLKYKTPLEDLLLVIEAIPTEYIRIPEIRRRLSNLVLKTTNISSLTKLLRMWLKVDPHIIIEHLEFILEQFANNERNCILSYMIEYLICEGIIKKTKAQQLLHENKEKWKRFIK